MDADFKRNKDGTLKEVSTMGDFIKKEKPTKEQLERQKLKAEYEKKYNLK